MYRQKSFQEEFSWLQINFIKTSFTETSNELYITVDAPASCIIKIVWKACPLWSVNHKSIGVPICLENNAPSYSNHVSWKKHITRHRWWGYWWFWYLFSWATSSIDIQCTDLYAKIFDFIYQHLNSTSFMIIYFCVHC